MHQLKVKGFDFMSLCSKKVGDGNNTSFWFDIWKGEPNLHDTFPRMFALETDKQSTIAAKIAQVDGSFRRPVRGGLEQDQFNKLILFIDLISLSSSQDRWVCNASGDGSFRVKDICNIIDDFILPSWSKPTRWVKFIPIKINIFVWRACRDYFPTRSNLVRRGVFIDSNACLICGAYEEDIHHILFQCDLAQAVLRHICRWWIQLISNVMSLFGYSDTVADRDYYFLCGRPNTTSVEKTLHDTSIPGMHLVDSHTPIVGTVNSSISSVNMHSEHLPADCVVDTHVVSVAFCNVLKTGSLTDPVESLGYRFTSRYETIFQGPPPEYVHSQVNMSLFGILLFIGGY
nr:RNA-directed DNA polymerase, eukaryota [Tanacetum cinerariifolium]